MKKSLLLRLVAMLLIVMTFALVASACGTKTAEVGDDDADTDTDTDTDDDDDYADLPDDLYFGENGVLKEINVIVADDIGTGAATAARSITVSEDEKENNIVNSVIWERNTNVAKKLGVDVVLVETTNLSGLSDRVQEVLLSGIDQYNIIGGYQYYSTGMTIGENAGLYLNYYDLDPDASFINLEKPYWEKKLTSEMAYKGASYYITGDLSLYYTGGLLVTYVNNRIWKNYAEFIQEKTGYTEIFDVVNNNKWTIDFMSDLVKQVWIDKNTNEKVDGEDQSGLIVISEGDLLGFMSGAHYTLTKWEEGKPQLDLYKDETYELYTALNKLYNQSNAYNYDYSYSAEDPGVLGTFAQGNILFAVELLCNSERFLSDMADDYSIIPCPAINDEQLAEGGYGYASNLHDCVTLYMLPYTNEDLPAVTATLELLGSESYRLVTPAYYETTLKTRYVRGDLNAASQMIDKIRNGLYFDFIMLNSSKVGGVSVWFRGNFLSIRSTAVMSTVKAKQRALNTALKNLLDDLDDAREVVR